MELDPVNTDAIVVRGKARMESQDFEAARLDFVEAVRLGARGVEEHLEELEGARKTAEKREKELWGDKDTRQELISGGYTFLGREEGAGLWGWLKAMFMRNPPAVLGLGLGVLFVVVEGFLGGWEGVLMSLGRAGGAGGAGAGRAEELRRIYTTSLPVERGGGGGSGSRGGAGEL